MFEQVFIPTVRIDLDVTLFNLNGDTELLRDIARIFIEDLPLVLIALRESLARRDQRESILHAHTIKGLASNFQAEPLTTLARKLEMEYALLSIRDREDLRLDIAEVSELTVAELKKEIDL